MTMKRSRERKMVKMRHLGVYDWESFRAEVLSSRSTAVGREPQIMREEVWHCDCLESAAIQE